MEKCASKRVNDNPVYLSYTIGANKRMRAYPPIIPSHTKKGRHKATPFSVQYQTITLF